MILVQLKDYNDLVKHKKTYSLLTKTACKTVVKSVLKYFDFTCWHDTESPDDGDGTCSHCPVITLLGDDAGKRICVRDKNWLQ